MSSLSCLKSRAGAQNAVLVQFEESAGREGGQLIQGMKGVTSVLLFHPAFLHSRSVNSCVYRILRLLYEKMALLCVNESACRYIIFKGTRIERLLFVRFEKEHPLQPCF